MMKKVFHLLYDKHKKVVVSLKYKRLDSLLYETLELWSSLHCVLRGQVAVCYRTEHNVEVHFYMEEC